MSALRDLLDRYRDAAATNREAGTYFEELTAKYLRTDPRYPLSLLLRVSTVGLETNRIVAALPALDILESP